jgi:cytochrome c-type biogenesis protein CcmH
VALAPRDVALSSRFAEILIQRSGGAVTPEARGLFEAMLAEDTNQPIARYYLGLADLQAGQRRKALARWLALEADAPVGAPWKAVLKSRIERLAKDTAIDGAALAAMRNEAAKRPAPDEPGAMIHAMVDRLAARLEKDPDDAEGWRRLARSYRVLGKPAMSRDALARAAALLPDDVAVLSDYVTAIVAAGGGKDRLPRELTRVTGEILKRDPDHPGALWYAGIVRMQADDADGALAHWRRLRTLLKPGTQQHDAVSRRIEALEKSPGP